MASHRYRTNSSDVAATCRAAEGCRETDTATRICSAPSQADDAWEDEAAHIDDISSNSANSQPLVVTSARDLQILLQQGEGTTLEYKEKPSDSFARELVALANTCGGKILLGVRDNGSVSGITDTNSLRARIQDAARNCDPPVTITVESVARVMVVNVERECLKARAMPRRLLCTTGRRHAETVAR